MSTIDPYQAPAADLERPATNRSTNVAVTEEMINALNQTRPWVLFLAILGFIGAGFMVLGGLIVIVSSLIGTAIGGGMSEFQGPAGIFLGLLYLVLSVLYIYPCLQLVRYGSAIGAMRGGETGPSIENALLYQQRFWRFAGITTIVMIALYIVVIFVVMIFAATRAAGPWM